MTLEATPVQAPHEILSLVEEDTSVVAIDEIQFFDRSILRVCNVIADQGRRAIVAGLDRDFRGDPFEAVADMITRIKVDRLRARCAICDMPADFSQRIIDGNPARFDSPLIMIGGPELYEPRCEEHFSVPEPFEELGDLAQRNGTTVSEQLPGIVDVSHRLVRWIDRLQAIARTGIGYALDDDRPERLYDQERYEELLKLAAEMQAFALNQEARLDQVLSERFYTDWRAQVQPGQRGYATPKITTSGAVFNDQGEILLARRRDSPYWDLPTGWCEVGLSAAKNAVKEILEETGLQTTPLQLVGIYDSQRWGFLSQTHLYALVFLCRIDGGKLKPRPVEIDQVGFFPEQRLPLLFPGVKLSIEHSFDVSRGERQDVYFDFVDSRTKQRDIR
jgi:ADP-ribose pyrophosphatase YjhB (NUDIX family)